VAALISFGTDVAWAVDQSSQVEASGAPPPSDAGAAGTAVEGGEAPEPLAGAAGATPADQGPDQGATQVGVEQRATIADGSLVVEG
jgi:hypothetical protein